MPRKGHSKPSLLRIRRLPITQGSLNLDAIAMRVHLNEAYVTLEKDGIPIAGIMDIDEFEDYLELLGPKGPYAYSQEP